MKAKKMKKLTLSKSTIANLSQRGMGVLIGGVLTNPTSIAQPDGTSCELPCDNETYSCIIKECILLTTDPTIGPDACEFC